MKEVLEKCQNMFGRILPEYKEKIKSYIIKSSPTTDDWADIAHILVTPPGYCLEHSPVDVS